MVIVLGLGLGLGLVPVQWAAGRCTFGYLRRRECLWPGAHRPCRTGVLYLAWYVHVSASRISSHRIGGRASQQQAAWSQKTDAGRCPRLPEQRPNRGVLRAAASRRAGPHPPQILKGRGDGFLFGGPGNSETWWGRRARERALCFRKCCTHKQVGGRYRQR